MEKIRNQAEKKMSKALDTFVTAVYEINEVIKLKEQLVKQVETDIASMEKSIVSLHAGIDSKQATLLSLQSEIKSHEELANRIKSFTG